jgi:hypothetical protein
VGRTASPGAVSSTPPQEFLQHPSGGDGIDSSP